MVPLLSVEEAKSLASQYFPDGVEKVACAIGAAVRRSRLVTKHGWCARAGPRVVIRINSADAPTRQRFTLAHELAHVLLGTSPDILATNSEPFASDRSEEKKANQVASELLLPLEHIQSLLTHVPIDLRTIKRIAARAKVSDLATACRLVYLARDLNLESAGVAQFCGNQVDWVWTTSIRVGDHQALLDIWQHLSEREIDFGRFGWDNANTVTACRVSIGTLFFQVLTNSKASASTEAEWLTAERQFLFQGQHRIEASVTSCLGWYKKQTPHATRSAEHFLLEHAEKKWPHDRLGSARGKEWIDYHLKKR